MNFDEYDKKHVVIYSFKVEVNLFVKLDDSNGLFSSGNFSCVKVEGGGEERISDQIRIHFGVGKKCLSY